MSKKLNAKQELFVKEYLKDFNGTQAAIRAGYSKRTARKIASEHLTKPDIQKAIQRAKAKRSEKLDISAEYVLKRHHEIDTLDVKDILTDELDSFRPLNEWPKAWRISINAIDIAHIITAGDDEPIEKVIKKIKWPDKVRNLEKLGEHVDVQAYKQQVQHSADNDLIDILTRARARSGIENAD